MAFTFINNFSTVTVNPLTPGDTMLELQSGFADVKAAVDSGDTLVLTLFETNESGEETGREIIHVTAADDQSETVTIERGKEGTADGDWESGTGIEQRLTAGALAVIYSDLGKITPTDDDGNIVSKGAAVQSGSYSVVIGDGAEVADSYSSYSVVIGEDAESSSAFSTAIGSGAEVHKNSDNATAVGEYSDASGPYALALGPSSGATAEDSIAIGNSASAGGKGSTAIGDGATASAVESISLGSGPEATVSGGVVLNALPYTTGNMLSASTEGDYASPAACRQASAQVTLTTHALDLTDATATVDLEMPAGAMLFIDSIDVVVVGSDSPGGSPEITIGPDDTAPAEYLATTAIGKTAVGGRESHDPLVADGVTSLRVATSTAGSGTAYSARIVFRGYVMEL